jgi:hypothetical protein
MPGASGQGALDIPIRCAYDFAEKLLATQREFAEELLRATTPLMPGTGDRTPKKKAAAE